LKEKTNANVWKNLQNSAVFHAFYSLNARH